jgi:pimeloyl-ACP methyl ester carboxylesterase
MAPRTEPLVWLRDGGASDVLPADGAFNLLASGGRCQEAQSLASTMPDRVRALVLVSPSCQPDSAVTVPTLVIAGTDEPCSVGPAFRAQLPNCHYVLVYAAGNDVAGDRPAAFGALVEDFLDRRERFIVSERSGLLHP